MKLETKTLEDLEQMQAEQGAIEGIYKVSDPEYHAFRAINSTSVKAAYVSMADFNAVYNPDEARPYEHTPSYFVFGSAFHAYVLDKEEFNRAFAIEPQFEGSKTKLAKNGGCKEIWEDWKKKNRHKNTLNDKDVYTIEQMVSNLNKSEYWQEFTKKEYFTEIAIFWLDETTGMQCKAKIDAISKSHGAVDLKTTSKEITDRGLKYAIKNYGYQFQEAHYVAGIRACFKDFPETFTLGWCQKNEPYQCRFTNLTRESIEKCAAEYEALMMDIQYSLENDYYPGPGAGNLLEVELYD